MSEHLAELREAITQALHDAFQGPEFDPYEIYSFSKLQPISDAALAAIRDAGYCVVRRDDVRSVVCQPCQPAMPGTAIHRLRAAVAEGDGA